LGVNRSAQIRMERSTYVLTTTLAVVISVLGPALYVAGQEMRQAFLVHLGTNAVATHAKLLGASAAKARWVTQGTMLSPRTQRAVPM